MNAVIKRIEPGYYEGPSGTVRNVYSASGAPHTRDARAKWLVTPLIGSSYFVPTLARAREVIGRPLREQLCAQVTADEARDILTRAGGAV